jgi:putative transposase
MTSTATSERPKRTNESFCTPESAVEGRNQTWKDRLPDRLTSILEPKWSEKLAAVSTSKDRSSLPYWNESVQEMSAQLWSLTGIDSAGLDLTSLRGIAVNTGARSWFSMIKAYLPNRNWLRTFLPSCTASVVGSTDSENTGLQSRKIRIYQKTGSKTPPFTAAFKDSSSNFKLSWVSTFRLYLVTNTRWACRLDTLLRSLLNSMC